MFQAGTPVDNPTSGQVLVTSGIVTLPRRYVVRVTVAAEQPFWATLVHRTAAGAERTRVFLPVIGSLLGPMDLYETYFANGEYCQVDVREGVTVSGTVQASVELA